MLKNIFTGSNRGNMKGTIRSLGKRLAALQTQLDNLHSTRSTLKLRGTILNAWCEGLNLMRGAEVCRHAVCGNWSDSSEQLEQLLQEEFQLLEQLGDGIAEVGEVPSLAAQTMAPAAEPMAFLQQLLSCPLPSVAAADNMAFAVVYRDAVQEGGMLLHALQAVPASSRPAILEHMQQLWNRCVCCTGVTSRTPLLAACMCVRLIITTRLVQQAYPEQNRRASALPCDA